MHAYSMTFQIQRLALPTTVLPTLETLRLSNVVLILEMKRQKLVDLTEKKDPWKVNTFFDPPPPNE